METACFERTGYLSASDTTDGEIDVENPVSLGFCVETLQVQEVFILMDKAHIYSSLQWTDARAVERGATGV